MNINHLKLEKNVNNFNLFMTNSRFMVVISCLEKFNYKIYKSKRTI